MTKDFLRDFRHGCIVHAGQEDHTFHMQLQVDTWRCRPLMIHVRVCAQRSSPTKTQGNLVCAGFSEPHNDEGTKALIFRVGHLVFSFSSSLLIIFTVLMQWFRSLTRKGIIKLSSFLTLLKLSKVRNEDSLMIPFRVNDRNHCTKTVVVGVGWNF